MGESDDEGGDAFVDRRLVNRYEVQDEKKKEKKIEAAEKYLPKEYSFTRWSVKFAWLEIQGPRRMINERYINTWEVNDERGYVYSSSMIHCYHAS